jgi:hypothetical protein
VAGRGRTYAKQLFDLAAKSENELGERLLGGARTYRTCEKRVELLGRKVNWGDVSWTYLGLNLDATWTDKTCREQVGNLGDVT